MLATLERITRWLTAWRTKQPGGLRPPLSEGEVERWEADHGVSLPQEYRRFITTVGDGGDGPYGDMVPLNDWWNHLTSASQVPEERWADWPAAPFRFQLPLGSSHGYLVQHDVDDDSDWPPCAGTISVCDAGCGSVVLLILNGPLVGRICEFDFLNAPYLFSQPDFISWYEAAGAARLKRDWRVLLGE